MTIACSRILPFLLVLLPSGRAFTPFGSPMRASSPSSIARQMSTKSAEAISADIQHAREVFQAFDADGSGTIGAEELGDMLSALDIDASEEEAAALFRYLDEDGTGSVSFEEFLPWYSEAAESAKQSAEVFQGIIMSRRTVDSFDKTEVDQAVIKRAIECAIAAPVSTYDVIIPAKYAKTFFPGMLQFFIEFFMSCCNMCFCYFCLHIEGAAF